jgi:hypothetical protein
MEPMVPSPPPAIAFSRRALLAASAAGVAVLAVGCTSSSGDGGEEVTSEQVDGLADQVAVQTTLVAAYGAAGAADPGLAPLATELSAQAEQQLTRLQDAAPGASASAGTSSPPAVGPDPRAWLREQVAAAATSHATACADQTGARAALLGSIAAGLRGQEGVLA